MILRLLVKWYLKRNRDINKISIGDEFNLMKFGSPDDILRLLKSMLTSQMLWYFETKNEEERNIIKGSSLVLKVLIDSHQMVMNIVEQENSMPKQIELYKKFKNNIKKTQIIN